MISSRIYILRQTNEFSIKANIITKNISKKKQKFELSIRWYRVLNKSILIKRYFPISKL